MEKSDHTLMILLIGILLVIGVLCYSSRKKSSESFEEVRFPDEETLAFPAPQGVASQGGGIGGRDEFAPWSDSDPLLGAGSGTYGRMRVEGPLEY